MLKWLGTTNPRVPLILTIPHSGETIPPEAEWLRAHPPEILLMDIDRFVDELYRPVTEQMPVPALVTRVHRYAADLNRFPEDAHDKGFHWLKTTQGQVIVKAPIPAAIHDQIVKKYHDPFHQEFEKRVKEISARFPGRTVFHLDCHSMPSVGTGAHTDPGKRRPDVVISDLDGQSASAAFTHLVLQCFRDAGLNVSHNDPYKGGRITERYGRLDLMHETIQIELNRALYMDEKTKERTAGFKPLQEKLTQILIRISEDLC